MAVSIGELTGTATFDDKITSPLEQIAKKLDVSTKSITALGQAAGLITGAIVGTTAAIVALGSHGADVNDVQGAFSALSARIGETGDAMLSKLNAGTLNTISNFDLMKASNGLLATGLIKSANDMGTLAASAKMLADRTGGDTATAFDTLTQAMARGQTRALKSVGDFSSVETAVDRYAQAVGKTPQQLTAHEQAAAKSAAILSVLKSELDKAGPASADFADRVAQGQKAVADFTDNVALAIANSPAMAIVMDNIASAIQNAFGSNQQAAVQTISDLVTQFAIGMTNLASTAVTVGEFIANAFNGVKLIFNTVLQALFEGIGGAASQLAVLADEATQLPVIGSGFQDLATNIHATADMANSLALGFKEQGDKAYDAAVTVAVAAQAMQTGITKVHDELVKVQGATVEVGSGMSKLPPVVKPVEEAFVATTAQVKAYDDAMLAAIGTANQMAADNIASQANLQMQIALLQTSGIAARLLELQTAYQAEIDALQTKFDVEGQMYSTNAALIAEKYLLMTQQAQGYYATAAQYAEANGFTTRDQMEQNVASALTGYMQMLQSGQFTAKELEKAWKKYTDAKKTMDNDEKLSALDKFSMIASAASSILTSIFGKNKKAAIAAAVIDAAAAIVKCFAQFGWFGFIPAAAVAAQTYAQIQKINSTNESFAAGTPGTSMVNFGAVTHGVDMHGREAVVNEQQSQTIAGMVMDATQTHDQMVMAGLDKIAAFLEEQNDQLSRDSRQLPIVLKAAMTEAMA